MTTSMAILAPIVDRFEIGALQLGGLDAVSDLLRFEITGLGLVER